MDWRLPVLAADSHTPNGVCVDASGRARIDVGIVAVLACQARTPPGTSMRGGVFERIARDAQGCRGVDAFRAKLLAALQGELGADSASMSEPPGRQALIVGVGIPSAYASLYANDRARYDGSIHRLVTAMRRGPTLDTDIYSARERARLAVYAEVLGPQGTRSILCTMVVHRGRPIAQLVLKRHGRGRPFRAEDAAALRQLLPAVALADAGYRALSCPPPAGATAARRAPLTARETQVAELACRGMHNAEIALLLGTSTETVKKQVRSALEKVGACNRTEMAMLWAGAPARWR
jgi:DNA-binding CsgD family transcriptional regulator